jgi:integrase
MFRTVSGHEDRSMPRRIRSKDLETRTARLKLSVRQKPYFVVVAPGIRLGYRRNRGPGTWSVEGGGGAWLDRFAHADDYEPADLGQGHVLDYWMAVDKARRLARGNGDNGQPLTVDAALTDYHASLEARGGAIGNVSRVRRHLTPTIAAQPVGLLEPRELAHWRDSLLATGLKPGTVKRICAALAAALTLASKHDQRITNREAWRTAFAGLSDTHNPRNTILSDDQARAIVAAAEATDRCFALYLETHAVTGARSSQIAALTIGDLQDGPAPRLLMPCSRKGRGRKAGVRKPVPITPVLASKLKQIAFGRWPAEPLLLRHDGQPWQPSKGDHIRLFRRAAERAGLTGVTVYALRHSSIVRSLLAGVPARIVAVTHDTSIPMLERTYSHYIADHADEVARRGLLDTATPLAEQQS